MRSSTSRSVPWLVGPTCLLRPQSIMSKLMFSIYGFSSNGSSSYLNTGHPDPRLSSIAMITLIRVVKSEYVGN